MIWPLADDAAPITYLDPKDEDDHGIVAIGGDLSVARLRAAYANGIFPWPHGDLPLLWFCPPQRAILRFADLHVPQSLKKALRRCRLRFTIDQDFPQMISQCRRIGRPDQDGTWITADMERAYIALHRAGDAHSVEAWDEEGCLVGGLYGVDSGGVFSGESMFHLVPNASKLALLSLIEHLAKRELDFIDIQQLTPHMQRLGAVEIPRTDFLDLCQSARRRRLRLFG